MSRNHRLPVFWIAIVALAAALAAALPASMAHAGLKDRLKQKVAEKTTKKAEDAVDKKVDGAADAAAGDASANAGAPSSGTAAQPGGGKASSVSTKFDYVPGDKPLFADDFTQDELGEFPSRWKLVLGTFEVAESEGERWLRCVSVDGTIRMKLPAAPSLPEFWTLEFDFYGEEPMGSALTVRGVDNAGNACWLATYPQGNDMAFRSGEIFSSTTLEAGTIGGRHHVMVMARGTVLKAYIDRQRMASVPDISESNGMPTNLEIRLAASTHPMITNVRYAEGCKPAADMLASGKLVTYGIRFASGSDVVEPESAPVLRQIKSYLDANAAVKLHIVGHTDNTGSASSNLDLSKRRAASVARVLSGEFGIAAERFTTDGKGDTETVASNTSAEGRAANRRVEFAKL
ncbi:MAG: OmpA family protein [bacterium]